MFFSKVALVFRRDIVGFFVVCKVFVKRMGVLIFMSRVRKVVYFFFSD